MNHRTPLALLCALCPVLVSCYADRPVLIVTGVDGGAGAGGQAVTGAAGGGGGTGGTVGTGLGGAGGIVGPGCDVSAIFGTGSNPAVGHLCTLAGACHDANGSAANFDMVTPGWEKRMVGAMPESRGATPSMCLNSSNQDRVYLVRGSQPAIGLFMDKFNAIPPCGARMPNLGSPLTAAELACVQQWANALTAAP